MKNKSICITLALLVGGLFTVPLAVALTEEASPERYVFNIQPKEMPGVTMDYPDKLHEFHVEALANAGKGCTACHFNNDESRFMGVSVDDPNMVSPKARRDFIHNTCTTCHVEMKIGPTITSCRSCHSGEFGAETGLARVMR